MRAGVRAVSCEAGQAQLEWLLEYHACKGVGIYILASDF